MAVENGWWWKNRPWCPKTRGGGQKKGEKRMVVGKKNHVVMTKQAVGPKHGRSGGEKRGWKTSWEWDPALAPFVHVIEVQKKNMMVLSRADLAFASSARVAVLYSS